MMTNADTLDMQCVDDDHVPGCPCHAGGDPIYRCWLCGRTLGENDADWRLVSASRGTEHVCDNCWSKGDEGIEIPLDYTTDVA